MKKLFAFGMAAAMTLALAACGGAARKPPHARISRADRIARPA